MGSRKEEERNEKIIRGLMKLPPNRRCINCNSMGPQYVCTNFWTFVCMTCSGIHREFTHRVKSVSMAKFTSQEVEALQNGGNQRARETYLKDWDFQRQRLPNNSNIDKIREFIKNVYADRKFAGGRTSEKPPRDMQNHRIQEDETRRASSYHSYSQSPPYDYQYEDRKYGKQAASLTRKPGSDRGRYEGKVSSAFSPGRLSDQMYEDRFADEGYVSRVSDFSVSSGGDLFRSGAQSPSFQKDSGFSSPPFHCARDVPNEDTKHQMASISLEANGNRDPYGISRPQRTMSLGSFGSIDRSLTSLKSYNSAGVIDNVSESEQITKNHQDKMPISQQSSHPGVTIDLSLFEGPFVPQPVSSAASTVDLLPPQVSLSAVPVDLFQLSSSSLSLTECQPPDMPPPQSLQFFSESDPQHSDSATLNKMSSELVVPKNEGWATFDSPLATSSVTSSENLNAVKYPSNDGALGKFDPFSSTNAGVQWPSIPDYTAHEPFSLMSSRWHNDLSNTEAPVNVTSTYESWNAFEDATAHLPVEGINQVTELQVSGKEFLPSADGHMFLGVTEEERPTQITSHKSTNPFDLPYDPDVEQINMFLDMSSLQSALPNAQLPATLIGGSQPWFPQNSSPAYASVAGQAGLTLMAGQTPGSQISNITSQEPVASIGGNPFA